MTQTSEQVADGTHLVVLTTVDGVVKDIDVADGQTVLQAAYEAQTILPALCLHGSCGVCLGWVKSGEYAHDDYSPEAIGPLAGEGAALLCCTRPTSDMAISLPYESSRIVDSAPPTREATITGLDRVSQWVWRIRMTLTPDDMYGSAAEFDSGQYMQIRLPGSEQWRTYSLANIGNWDGELEFFIHQQQTGLMSDWLRSGSGTVGDVVTVRGPSGAFQLMENGTRPRWFIGGGSGLAPLLSMARRMAEWGEPQAVRIYLGVNTVEDVFCLGELTELADQLTDVEVRICVWKPDGDLPESGHDKVVYVQGTPAETVGAALARFPAPPDMYACGPTPMVMALENALADAEVSPDFVLMERFS